MKNSMRKIIVVIIGIIVNVLGRFFAYSFGLPIWFDMTGTCIATYYTGIWGGIATGLCSNLLSGSFDVTAFVYSLISIIAAIVMHLFIKKGYMNNALKAAISSFWLGILCMVVSTPLNLIFYNGYSGNIWGDALVDMLRWHGISDTMSALAGEAIIEIPDKQICVMAAYLIIFTVNYLKKENGSRIKILTYVLAAGVSAYLIAEQVHMLVAEMVSAGGAETVMWEIPWYKTYMMITCAETCLFTLISIVSMVFYTTRKNELEQMQMDLKMTVINQIEELQIQQKKTKKLFLQTVTALSEAVDAKDRYTSGHSKRVAEYARTIAARMGKSKEEQEEIYRAGLLHDVGKIRIPGEIINKTGRLTDDEFNVIKIHPVTGYHILRDISDSKLIAIGAKYHHERYDGKGYPNGLAGKKIPEVARILGVADAYDAMTSNRSYREALSQEVVRSEIEKGKGTQFDPDIADIMLQMIDADKEYTMKQADSMHKKILVVDDEPMNIKLIENIMQDEPMYEIIPAYSGREALEIVEQQPIDLILLDVRMPDMDGLETLRRIREKHQTPVAFITADKNIDTFNEFAALGCDDYITKPFPPLLLREIVHNMTERTVLEE